MPVTVDNLGRGPSERFAQDQNKYDPSLRKEASTVSQKAQVAVLSPTPDRLSIILSDGLAVQPQASFVSPNFYLKNNSGAFATQLTSAIGPSSKWESSSQKIRSVLQSLPDNSSEKAILTKFIDTANQINKDLIAIKSELNRYHRG